MPVRRDARLRERRRVLTFDRAGQMIPEERAYTELRARILDLRLRPGSTVPEVILAAELGISRTLLHTALLRLHAEGLLEPAARRGYCVVAPTVEALREIYEIVGALEGQAVRRTVREGGSILHAALQAAVEEQDRALDVRDMDAWGRADRRFHELLREGTINSRLRQLFVHYEGQLQQARAATLHLRARPTLSTADHHAILRMILDGDEEGASRAHAAHRQRADAEMLEAIRALSNLHGPLGARPVELPVPGNGTAPVPISETAVPPLPAVPPAALGPQLPVVPPVHTPTPARPGHSLWRRFSAASGKAGGS
jgi:DNA-binding GntR family transcriptional regulator